jgi:hypothetical protein
MRGGRRARYTVPRPSARPAFRTVCSPPAGGASGASCARLQCQHRSTPALPPSAAALPITGGRPGRCAAPLLSPPVLPPVPASNFQLLTCGSWSSARSSGRRRVSRPALTSTSNRACGHTRRAVHPPRRDLEAHPTAAAEVLDKRDSAKRASMPDEGGVRARPDSARCAQGPSTSRVKGPLLLFSGNTPSPGH